jgi:hypothetical protein
MLSTFLVCYSFALSALTSKEYCLSLSTKTYEEKCKTELNSIEFLDETALKNCYLINGKDSEKINCLREIANKTFTTGELEKCRKFLDGYLAEYTGLCFRKVGRDYQKGELDYRPMENVTFNFEHPLGTKAMCNSLPLQMCKGNCYINKNKICTAHY